MKERDPVFVVTAPSRLHFGLIGLAQEGSRSFGGVGLCINHRVTQVRVRRIRANKIALGGLPRELSTRVGSVLTRAGFERLDLQFTESAPPHCGFGLGTASLLAAIEGASLASDRQFTREGIVSVSGRGGASGIGVTTYFSGGLVADLGHCRSLHDEFLPSRHRDRGFRQAPLLRRVSWPKEWPVVVILPRGADHRLSGTAERAFMADNSPLPLQECAVSSFALYLEVLGSVVDRTFDGFKNGLRRSRKSGFKRREIDRLPDIQELVERIDRESDQAVSMSSFGPAVFVAFRTYASAAAFSLAGFDGEVITGPANNSGRRIDRL